MSALSRHVANLGVWPALTAIGLALLAGSILLSVCGYEPMKAWGSLVHGAFGIDTNWHFSDGIGSLIRRRKA